MFFRAPGHKDERTDMVRTDGRSMGWAVMIMLLFTLSSSAWALDFDQSIQRQESDNAQILNSLGRDRDGSASVSNETRRTVKLQLIRKPKAKRLVRR